jgi:hypothetical protein
LPAASARCAIAEVKQLSQILVIGWVTKIYYLEILCNSEGTLSRSLLCLQSLAPTPVSRRVDVRQAAGRKKFILLLNLYHNMMKNIYRPNLVG